MIAYIAIIVISVAVMVGAAYVANHSDGKEKEIAQEVEKEAEEFLIHEVEKDSSKK